MNQSINLKTVHTFPTNDISSHPIKIFTSSFGYNFQLTSVEYPSLKKKSLCRRHRAIPRVNIFLFRSHYSSPFSGNAGIQFIHSFPGMPFIFMSPHFSPLRPHRHQPANQPRGHRRTIICETSPPLPTSSRVGEGGMPLTGTASMVPNGLQSVVMKRNAFASVIIMRTRRCGYVCVCAFVALYILWWEEKQSHNEKNLKLMKSRLARW